MTEPRPRIVVALDLSEYAEVVLEHALDQAGRYRSPDLHFLTVIDDAKADVDEVKSRLAALVLPALDGLDCTDWNVRLHVREGSAADEITNLAAEIRAKLIVVGRFGVHHPHRRIGFVASHVIDHATCPTLVVGLSDSSGDAQAQCPECVAVRAESDGEQWFCAAHAAPDRMRLSALVPSTGSTGGGLMW